LRRAGRINALMHSFPGGAVPIVQKNGHRGTSILPILFFGMSTTATLRWASNFHA
jgi:hypothetical protein